MWRISGESIETISVGIKFISGSPNLVSLHKPEQVAENRPKRLNVLFAASNTRRFGREVIARLAEIGQIHISPR